MVRLIAYVFTNEKWYNNQAVHDKLEAWYWSAVFSGEYDKDQNERYESNLRNMIKSLTIRKEGYSWIESLKNIVLEKPYFSECSFLLMDKAEEDRVPKEHLGKYFCQFFLSRPYSDLIDDTKQINVFSDEKLEKHHIIPLGSVTKISESTEKLRKDKAHILNSPLNYVFITSDTNSAISDKSLKEYEDSITASSKAALSIVNYPQADDLEDSDIIRKWLEERHKLIMGQIRIRITNLLATT